MNRRPPLTGGQLRDLHRRLMDLRRHLLAQFGHLESGSLGVEQGESIGELSTYDNHPADLGSETFERSKDLALKGLVRSRIGQVDAALERMKAGLYGLCAACGRPIPRPRLEAVPEAVLCTACARIQEAADQGRPDPAGRHRPVEEEILRESYSRLFGRNRRGSIGYDQEDAWQEVARYGTSDTPQDVPGAPDYGELFLSADERTGAVEPIEELLDQEGDVVTGAGGELVDEAASDEKANKAIREGETVSDDQRGG